MEDEDQGECTGITGRTEQVIERILVKVKTLFWFSFFSGWGFQDRSIMNSCKFPCVEIAPLGRGENFAEVRFFFCIFKFFFHFFFQNRGGIGPKIVQKPLEKPRKTHADAWESRSIESMKSTVTK